MVTSIRLTLLSNCFLLPGQGFSYLTVEQELMWPFFVNFALKFVSWFSRSVLSDHWFHRLVTLWLKQGPLFLCIFPLFVSSWVHGCMSAGFNLWNQCSDNTDLLNQLTNLNAKLTKNDYMSSEFMATKNGYCGNIWILRDYCGTFTSNNYIIFDVRYILDLHNYYCRSGMHPGFFFFGRVGGSISKRI